MNELKEIPEFPDYCIDKNGNVWSYKKYGNLPLPRKLKIRNKRYKEIRLYSNGKSEYKLIHRLVLETFIGPCPEGMETCHNDGNSKNNKLSNLRWDTHKNNEKDKIKHGIYRYGENNSRAKLNELQVRIIKWLLDNTYMTRKEIGKLFKVKPSTINNIAIKLTWNHIK